MRQGNRSGIDAYAIPVARTWPTGQKSAGGLHWYLHHPWRDFDVQYRILTAILLAIPLVLTGCNTLEGAGEDVQEAGEEMEEAGDE